MTFEKICKEITNYFLGIWGQLHSDIMDLTLRSDEATAAKTSL